MSVASADKILSHAVLPAFERSPKAHRIRSETEAIDIAKSLAVEFAKEAAERDRVRRLPVVELDRFSGSGPFAWAIAAKSSRRGRRHPCIGDGGAAALWFGRVLEGYRLGNAFSEAKSRHVGAFETRLTRQGDTYVVNGEKFYATGALLAHFIHIGAVDENDKVHLAIAPRDAPGLTVIDNWSGFGQRTTASGNVLIDNVRLGAEAIIPAYRGAENPSSNGAVSQIIQAAVDAGIARGAVEETRSFVRNHTRPWIDSGQEHGYEDVFTLAQIGDLQVKLHAAEALLERAGRAVDAIIENPSRDAVAATAVAVAQAKILTTEIAILATNKLHELGGTRSTLEQHNLDRHWRNARTHTLHDPVRWKYFHIGNHALNGIPPPSHAWS